MQFSSIIYILRMSDRKIGLCISVPANIPLALPMLALGMTKPSRDIQDLLAIMSALRDKATGCPWDIEQTFSSIAPYAVEEAHEVMEAVASGDREDLRDELGDLLLQVVFQAQIASEEGAFDFGGVVEAITTKMIRRHPHVFGERRNWSSAEVKESWGLIKAMEKAERRQRRQEPEIKRMIGEGLETSVLDGVSAALPAGLRAVKLQEKAAKVGFDWPNISDVLDKAHEEILELKEAVSYKTAGDIEEELGDLMFVLANVSRWQKLDPDMTLSLANAKFERRFRHVEEMLRQRGKTPETSSLAEMDALWNEAKLK
jgi:nucleoside triphosphate diphosphatase